MSTLSVPLPAKLEDFINDMVRRGYASNKADVVRRAILRMAEDEAVLAVLQGEQDIKEGRVVRGDLRKILKAMH